MMRKLFREIRTAEISLNLFSQLVGIRLLKVLYWLVVSFVTFLFVVFYANSFFKYDDPRTTLGNMVYGTAYKPFVYRILLPGTVQILLPLVPQNAGWKLPLCECRFTNLVRLNARDLAGGSTLVRLPYELGDTHQ